MATSGTMKINVVGDASKFNRTLGRTQRQLGALGGVVRKTSGRVALGLAGAGTAAVAAAGKLARFGDEVADSAQRAGLGNEKYQEMKFALDELGVAAPDKAMQKFNRRIGEAADGSGAAVSSVEALNLSLKNADGSLRDTGEVMDDAIGKLAGIEDESRRAAIAGNLFGKKAGPELVADLGKGGASVDELRQKAQDMGLVMGDEAIEASQKFSGALDDVKNRALGLLRQGLTPVLMFITDNVIPFIGDKVIPALASFSEWLGPKLKAAASIAQDAFDTVFSAAKSVFDLLVRGDFTKEFADAFNVAEDADIVGFLLNLRDKAIEVADKVVTAFRKIADWWSDNKDDIVRGAKAVRDAAIDMASKIRHWVETHLLPPLNAFGDLVKTLLGSGGDIRSDISDFVGWLGPFWSRHGDDIEEEASESWTAIKEEIEDLLKQAKTIIQGITATISGDWDDFLDTLQKDFEAFDDDQREEWESFMKGLRTTVAVISDLIVLDWQSALDRVRGRTDEHATTMENDWTRHTDKLKTVAGAAYDIIKGDWNSALTTVREDLLGWEQDIFEVWDDFWSGIRETAAGWLDDTLSAIRTWMSDTVGWFNDLPSRILGALGDLGGLLVQAGKDLLGGLAKGVKSAVGALGSALKSAVTSAADKIPFVDASGDGPGFGVPGIPGGGAAMDRAQAAMDGLPVRVTSTYRTPEENARVGGSPTSFHLDKSNPAVDIGGPMWALDVVAARLREMNANRELLWRTAGHLYHVHVAHSGGTVTRQGIEPLKADEVVAKLRAGETVRTRQQESELQRGGGTTINQTFVTQGNVRADAQAAKLALMR